MSDHEGDTIGRNTGGRARDTALVWQHRSDLQEGQECHHEADTITHDAGAVKGS